MYSERQLADFDSDRDGSRRCPLAVSSSSGRTVSRRRVPPAPWWHFGRSAASRVLRFLALGVAPPLGPGGSPAPRLLGFEALALASVYQVRPSWWALRRPRRLGSVRCGRARL